jgi:hypothetical protein
MAAHAIHGYKPQSYQYQPIEYNNFAYPRRFRSSGHNSGIKREKQARLRYDAENNPESYLKLRIFSK